MAEEASVHRVLSCRVKGLGSTWTPKVGNSPKPLNIAQKAMILHTFGVQVGFRVSGLGRQQPCYFLTWYHGSAVLRTRRPRV